MHFDTPWAFEPCPSCGRPLPLATHELTCPCFDARTRVAVAWICDDCDLIACVVGLFTTWLDALAAHQRTLDDRAVRHLGCTSPNTVSLACTNSPRPGT